MGVAKVILNGDTLMDVTQKTVTANTMLSGTTALAADGEGVVGSIGIYNGDVEPASIVPAEYQRVNYIQSSGSEYIDTGIYGDQTTSLEMTMQRLTALNQGAIRMFGSRTGVASNGFFLSTLNNGKVYIDMGASASGTQTTAQCMWTLDKVNIFFDDNGYSYGGTDYTWATDHHGQSFVTPDTLTIFNARSGGSFSSGMSAKLYSIIIKKNGEEVFNGVPCYRLADDVAGLYDTVSQSFFVNASGSGEFVVGDDVHVRSAWPRPSDWPDYDKIDISEEECMFFTYDSSDKDGIDFVGIYADCTGGYTVERGTIESDGSWVVDKTTAQTTGSVYTDTLPTDRNYTVYKLRPTNEGSHITGIAMNSPATYNGYSGQDAQYRYQKCVERYGNLPYASMIGPGYAYRGWACQYLVAETQLSTASLTSMYRMYTNSVSLRYLDVSDWDVSHVTTFNEAFSGCRSLAKLDVSKWDTSAVTNMASTFHLCSHLEELDVSGWDTGLVTNMSNMFNSCDCLRNLDVSEWDVGSVTNMQSIFAGCYSLEALDVSKWDTAAVQNMSSMFSGCQRLHRLNLSQWDTSAVTTMANMFNSCATLESFYAPNWNVELVTTMSAMFTSCNYLQSVDMTNWKTSALTTNSTMFRYCYCLANLSIGTTRVDANTFGSAGFVTDYVFTGDTVPELSNTSGFSGNHFSSGQRIKFKAELVEEAKIATNWSTYADYIVAIE